MRRSIILLPLLLAGCGEGTAPQEQAAGPVNAIEAGLWEVTREVASVRNHDEATPVIQAQQGDTETSRVCVGEGETTRPQPALFASEGFECDYRNFYMRGGTLNASLSCTRPGAQGQISKSLSGRFTADSFEGNLETLTYLATPGNVTIGYRINGSRVGDCPAEAAGEAPAAQ